MRHAQEVYSAKQLNAITCCQTVPKRSMRQKLKLTSGQSCGCRLTQSICLFSSSNSPRSQESLSLLFKPFISSSSSAILLPETLLGASVVKRHIRQMDDTAEPPTFVPESSAVGKVDQGL